MWSLAFRQAPTQGLFMGNRMLFTISEPRDILVIRKLHAALSDLRNTPQNFRDVLAGLCRPYDPYPYVLMSAMNTFMSATPIPKPESGRQSLWTAVSVNHGDPYKGTKPTSCTIGCWQFEPSDWWELVHATCEILYLEHPETFRDRALKVTGPRRKYLSENAGELRRSKLICNSGLYVEIRLAANNSVSFVNELAHLFGYEKPEIEYY